MEVEDQDKEDEKEDKEEEKEKEEEKQTVGGKNHQVMIIKNCVGNSSRLHQERALLILLWVLRRR